MSETVDEYWERQTVLARSRSKPAAQPAPGRLTEDEIKQLILSASTDYERYTAGVIARQRKQITALEVERDSLREKAALADTLRADLNGGHSVYWMADRLEKWSEEYDALDAAQKEGR